MHYDSDLSTVENLEFKILNPQLDNVVESEADTGVFKWGWIVPLG